MPLIAPRLCGWCHDPFTPRRDEQKFCCHRCGYLAVGKQRKGIAPAAAVQARRQAKGTAAAAALAARFGELSDREKELYGFAHSEGYKVGYDVAYFPTKKRGTAA